MSMMPPKAAKTCTISTHPGTLYLSCWKFFDYVGLCWSMLIYINPNLGQLVLNPYPGRSKSSVRTCTSRRDFLRVSTLILSLRLFTYLPDLKGIGQARLEPKLQLPAMPAILITCLLTHFPSSNQQILPDPTIPELPTKSGSLPWTHVDHKWHDITVVSSRNS